MKAHPERAFVGADLQEHRVVGARRLAHEPEERREVGVELLQLLGTARPLTILAQRRDRLIFFRPRKLLQSRVQAQEAILGPLRALPFGSLHEVEADDGEEEQESETRQVNERRPGLNGPVRHFDGQHRRDHHHDETPGESYRGEPAEHEIESLPVRAGSTGELYHEVDAADEEDEKRELVEERVLFRGVAHRGVREASEQDDDGQEADEVARSHIGADANGRLVEKESGAARDESDKESRRRGHIAPPSRGDE